MSNNELNEFKEIKENKEIKDDIIKNNLRPNTLNDYIGQDHIKEELLISIEASNIENKPLPHILFYGAPGLGKTTIANIIANEKGSKLHIASAPSIEKLSDLATLLVSLKEGDVLFIDEIHAFKTKIEESLYSVLEDYRLDIPIEKSGTTNIVSLPISPFTLIAATTKPGSITQPLRTRFPMIHQLKYYTDEELSRIIKRSSLIEGLDVSEDACLEIAKRSRSTARLANNLLIRLKPFSIVKKNRKIDLEFAIQKLDDFKIDKIGLSDLDRKVLYTLKNILKNKPTGLKRLASYISEDEKNIELMIEPFLIQKGLLKKTNQGRQLTEEGLAYTEKYITLDDI